MIEFLNKYISLIIIGLFGAVTAYNGYKKDDNGVDDRLISNYKALDELQKKQLAEKDALIKKYQDDALQFQKDMSAIKAEFKSEVSNLKENFAKETGQLQGQLNAKDKELDSLRATILNPSLDLGSLLTDIRNFMEQLTLSNKHQVDMLENKNK